MNKAVNLDREDFIIYCLLYAIDSDINIRKQYLAELSLKTDTVSFVKLYNLFQSQDKDIRLSCIKHNKETYIKSIEDISLFIKDLCKTFFSDNRHQDIKESVIKTLEKI